MGAYTRTLSRCSMVKPSTLDPRTSNVAHSVYALRMVLSNPASHVEHPCVGITELHDGTVLTVHTIDTYVGGRYTLNTRVQIGFVSHFGPRGSIEKSSATVTEWFHGANGVIRVPPHVACDTHGVAW
jgi:hypothetical protein